MPHRLNLHKERRSVPAAPKNKSRLTYRDAGVDIDAGNALVEAIGPLAKATKRTGALGAIGGFGGLFDLKPCGFKDPVLVAATDGVGTKLKLAIETGLHEGIGIDLVAMNVNDLVVQGAEPLFFLDYFASGKLDLKVAETVIGSIASGCKEAGCALIGGETAEMPGLYATRRLRPRRICRRRGGALGAAAAQGHRCRRPHPRAPLLRRARQRLLPGAPRGRAIGLAA